LGHDHAEPAETREMQLRERVHLAALGHSHPEQP
jgi:ssRNA-specific RNase YbeY (16S rRNA maturation enzyme)